MRSPRLTRADLWTFGQQPAQSDLQPPARKAAWKYALNENYIKEITKNIPLGGDVWNQMNSVITAFRCWKQILSDVNGYKVSSTLFFLLWWGFKLMLTSLCHQPIESRSGTYQPIRDQKKISINWKTRKLRVFQFFIKIIEHRQNKSKIINVPKSFNSWKFEIFGFWVVITLLEATYKNARIHGTNAFL